MGTLVQSCEHGNEEDRMYRGGSCQADLVESNIKTINVDIKRNTFKGFPDSETFKLQVTFRHY